MRIHPIQTIEGKLDENHFALGVSGPEALDTNSFCWQVIMLILYLSWCQLTEEYNVMCMFSEMSHLVSEDTD